MHYRFGEFELISSTRELLFAGKPRAIEPQLHRRAHFARNEACPKSKLHVEQHVELPAAQLPARDAMLSPSGVEWRVTPAETGGGRADPS